MIMCGLQINTNFLANLVFSHTRIITLFGYEKTKYSALFI